MDGGRAARPARLLHGAGPPISEIQGKSEGSAVTFLVVVFLMLMVVAQGGLNWALLNRLLVAKGVSPVVVNTPRPEADPVVEPARRKLFSVRVAD